MTRLLALGASVALLGTGLAACGDDDDVGDVVDTVTGAAGTVADEVDDAFGEDLTVRLEAVSGSGINGEAKLTAEDDGQTKVEIELDGAAGPHPAHIHEGTCANLETAPKFPLTDVTDGVSETTVSIALETLRSTPHAINVHRSAEDLQTYVACGEIPADGSSSGTGTTTDGTTTDGTTTTGTVTGTTTTTP